jgi:hypothetical protein
VKICARCKATKSQGEFYKSKRFRDGLRTWCRECDRESARTWGRSNSDRRKETMIAWRASNQQQEIAWRRAYYTKNREHIIAANVARERKHPERKRLRDAAWRARNRKVLRARALEYAAAHREQERARAKAWAKANHGRVVANVRLREAREKRAMPKWANRFFIGEIYDLARLRTKLLGEPWHVDHMVPLVSDTVCGLHVEHNMRVIPGSMNRAKSNSHWPDKP